jgi:hypothetical protein
MCIHIQLFTLRHFNWVCLTTLHTALILLQVTTTCLPAWRAGCNRSVSTIMSWWKVSKRGWAHRWQISLTQVETKTYSLIQVPQLWPWLWWEAAEVCVYCLYVIIFLVACFVKRSPEVTFQICLIQILKLTVGKWWPRCKKGGLDMSVNIFCFKDLIECSCEMSFA